MAQVTLEYTIGGDETTSDSYLIFRIYNYGVLYHTTGSSITDPNVSVGVGTATIENLTVSEDTTYSFTVSEVDEAGNEGDQSNAVVVTTSAEVFLTPIMTNFRVLDSNKNRIYFDTPLGSVSGIDYTDFTITGEETITGVNTTSNYFTLSGSYNYWNQAITIRKEAGNSVGCHDFEMQSVYNNISVPATTINKYVAVGASGTGDSIGDPMVWSDAQSVSAGTKVHWKKGDYGSINFVQATSGTVNAPIIHEGYDTTPGDNPSQVFTPNIVLSASLMPFINDVGNGGKGFNYNAKSYIIVKNIQVQGYNESFTLDNCDYVRLENCYADEGYDLITSFANSLGINQSVVDCYARNATGYGFHMSGRGHLMDGCFATSNRNVGMDYYLDYTGSNIVRSGEHVMRNCTIDRFITDSHGGHGVSAYGVKPHNYTLIENIEIIDILQVLEARRSGTGNCVFRDIEIKNNNYNLQQAINISSAYECTFDNIRQVEGGKIALNFYSSKSNDANALDCGRDNVIKNSIFSGGQQAFTVDGDVTEPTYALFDTKVINCTFDNYTNFFFNEITNSNSTGNEIIGCIINDCTTKSGTANDDVFSFTYSDFFGGFATPSGTGNFSEDPILDANFEPTATFIDIDVPRNSSVLYDANSEERDNPTTVGAVKHADEVIGEVPRPELVTDGGFDQGDTHWTCGGANSLIENGVAKIITTGAYAVLYQETVMDIGESYRVKFDVVSTNGETLTDDYDNIIWDTVTTGSKTQDITATETRLMFKRRVGTTNTNVWLDNISVKLL